MTKSHHVTAVACGGCASSWSVQAPGACLPRPSSRAAATTSTLVDRHGPWQRVRLVVGTDPAVAVVPPGPGTGAAGRRAVDAWRRLESRCGEELLLRRGLLWRDSGSNADLAEALTAEAVPFTAVDAADVGSFLPGLRPPAWTRCGRRRAGPVRADRALSAQLAALLAAGGTVVDRPRRDRRQASSPPGSRS